MGAVILPVILIINFILYLFDKGKRWISAVLLLSLSATVALVSCFAATERTMAAVYPFQGEKLSLTAQVMEWDVADYGCKYLVRTVGNEEIPNGILARVYSYGESAADEGNLIHFSSVIETKLKNYDYGRNIFFYAFAGEEPIERLQKGESIRGKLMQLTEKLYDPPVLGLIQGVLFGEKKNMEAPFSQMMKQAGLVHLLAVSGIHISLLAAFFTKFLKSLKIPSRIANLISLFMVWGYVALAQFSPSAVRAGIMASFYAVGFFLGRENDSLSALSAAAILIVGIAPFSIYSVSFQLSFLVTLGIVLCAKPLTQLFNQSCLVAFLMGTMGRKGEKIIHSACVTVATTLAASVFSAPLLLYYFYSLPVWGILAALLALWAVSPLMILAMLSLGFGIIWLVSGWGVFLIAANTAAGLAGIFARWILLVSKAVSQLPFTTFDSHEIPVMLCFCVVLVLVFMMTHHFAKLPLPQRTIRAKCCFSGCVLCFCSVMIAHQLAGASVLSVFSTENALILCKDEQAAVVGDIKSVYEEQEISSILRCEQVDSLELLFCDSTTTDKSYGLDTLLSEFDTKVAVVEPQGALYPHIQKAMYSGKMVAPQGISARLMGDITIRQGEDGIQIFAAGKKLLKASENYDIIEGSVNDGYDAVWESGNWNLEPCQEMGLFSILREKPVLKLRMDRKAGTQNDF